MPAFPIELSDIRFMGTQLHRPECVLATAGGDVFTADWRGGVVCVRPDGSQHLIVGKTPANAPPLRPNGIALEPDGSFLVADLSDARAGVWHLQPSGEVSPFILAVDGRPIPPVNFVYRDEHGRIWITVSTRVQPRALDYRPTASSGYVVLVDQKGSRIVADGLGYTNECRVDPTGRWLYVNETFARRLTRFPIRGNGSLGRAETVTTFGYGTFPDGLEMDVDGHVWITSIISNRVIRIAPDGTQVVVLEDADPEHLARVEKAFQAGELDRSHLDNIRSRKLRSISSLAFGGPDLKTVFLGCLLGDCVATFRSPVAGVAPPHWTYDQPII